MRRMARAAAAKKWALAIPVLSLIDIDQTHVRLVGRVLLIAEYGPTVSVAILSGGKLAEFSVKPAVAVDPLHLDRPSRSATESW